MLEITAPAKINLFLHVLNRRVDGYHELVTRMQKIDLCDRLFLSLGDNKNIECTCSDPDLPVDSDNLAVIAARAFIHYAGSKNLPGIRIRLVKYIPVSAGLGGGSSDAGAVLRGLNELFDFPFSEDQLVEMAKNIGADVPFFAARHNAVIASGIGDRLSPVEDLDGFWVILINPGICVSTRAVFENYALTSLSKNSNIPGFRNSLSDSFSLEQMHNDLESVTIPNHPVIKTIKQELVEAGAVAAMMSGSGPTVYGLFTKTDYTVQEIERLVKTFSLVYGRRVYATRTYAGA